MGAWAGQPSPASTGRSWRRAPRNRPAYRPDARDRCARGRALRAARGGLLGVLSVGLSSAAHAGAGGHVSVPMLAVLALAGAAGFTALSDREWRLPRLVGTLAAGQGLLHVLLSVGGAHAPAGLGGHVAGAGGHLSHAGTITPTGTMEHAGGAAGPGMLAMLAAHGAALLAVAVLVRQGEDLLLRAACALRAATRPLVDRLGLVLAIRPADPARIPAGARRLVAHPGDLLAHSVGRRGPPVPHPA